MGARGALPLRVLNAIMSFKSRFFMPMQNYTLMNRTERAATAHKKKEGDGTFRRKSCWIDREKIIKLSTI